VSQTRFQPIRASVTMAVLALSLSGCGGSSSNNSSTNSNQVTMSPPNGTTLPDATVGQSYTQTFTVESGGVAPYKLIPSGTPLGMTFTTPNTFSGTLSGTPAQSGTGAFDLQVIDSTQAVTQLSFVLTINASTSGSLAITPATLPAGTNNTAYSESLTVTGGTAPYTWSLASGSLPPGIALTSSGANATLAGTPTSSGAFTFTISVHDSSSTVETGSLSYTLTIN
jgi:hypothetical protein